MATSMHDRRSYVCQSGALNVTPCNPNLGSIGAYSTASKIFEFNNGTSQNKFTVFSCSVSGSLSSCSVSPTSATIVFTDFQDVTVTYTSNGQGGTGTVSVTGLGLSSTGTVMASPANVVVMPKSSATVNQTPGGTYTQAFQVNNNTASSVSMQLSLTCSASISCQSITSPVSVGSNSTYTANVTYTTGGVGSSGTVQLNATNGQSGQTNSDDGYITVAAPDLASISTTGQAGEAHLIGDCAVGCFDVGASYSSAAYVSLDVARSLSLVYSSARAHPMGLVQLDVSDAAAPQQLSLTVDSNTTPKAFVNNGSTELFFNYTGLVGHYVRLAGQFDATGLTTGEYAYSATVTSYWTGSSPSHHATPAGTAYLQVINDQASPYGAGWSLAGVQHLYVSPTDAQAISATDGAGSISTFHGVTAGVTGTSPTGDFSALSQRASVGSDGVKYDRRYPGGTTYSFLSDGRLSYIKDRFGNTTNFAYDGNNNLQYITDPAGKIITLGYTNNKLSSITDPGGRVALIQIDGSGNLTQITDPTGTVAFRAVYDGLHRLTQRTDRGNNTWLYTYDFAGKIASDSTPAVLAGGVTQRLGTTYYSAESRMLIDPGSSLGTSTAPATPVLSDSLRAVVIVPSGDSTRYALNAFGAATTIDEPLLKTTVVTRNSADQVTSSVTTVRGIQNANTSATWDGPRQTSTTDNVAHTSQSISYDATYSIPTHIWGSTVETWNYLDATKVRIDSTRVGSGDSVTTFWYDGRGRVLKLSDPRQDTTVYSYDSGNFQNTIQTTVGNRITKLSYDGYGRTTRMIDPNSDTTTVGLDSLNRVRTRAASYPGRSAGVVTTFTYDSLSQVATITDATGQSYQFVRNPLGWLLQATGANTNETLSYRQESYSYSKAGLGTAHIDRDGRTTRMGYDVQGRPVADTLSDGRVMKFSYDTAGYWSADSSREGVDTVRVDAATHRTVTEVSVRNGVRYVVTSPVDSTGLLRSQAFRINADTGATTWNIAYGYDGALRLNALTVSYGATSFGTTGLQYNADGLVTQVALPTPDTITYGYTGQHTIASITHSVTALQNVFGKTFAFDTLNRVVQVGLAWDSTRTYGYDALGRLTGDTTWYLPNETCVRDPSVMDGQRCTSPSPVVAHASTFGYDVINNRTDQQAAYNPENRQTSFAGVTMTYDHDGELLTKSGNGLTQSFYWNSLGQLDSVTTNAATVRFGYDGFGRRTRKSSSSGTIYYIYSGQDVFAEIDSATGSVVRSYSYYPGTDMPHMMQEGGARYYYAQDRPVAGNIVGLINNSNSITNRYRYAPFGTLEDSVEGVVNPKRFTGRDYDAEARLYYYRARYYDAQLARFISQDPAGLDDANNQYAYAGNDPINRTDPFGQDWVDEHLAEGGPCEKMSLFMDGGNCFHAAGGRGTLGFAGDCIGWCGLADVSDLMLFEALTKVESEQQVEAKALAALLNNAPEILQSWDTPAGEHGDVLSAGWHWFMRGCGPKYNFSVLAGGTSDGLDPRVGVLFPSYLDWRMKRKQGPQDESEVGLWADYGGEVGIRAINEVHLASGFVGCSTGFYMFESHW